MLLTSRPGRAQRPRDRACHRRAWLHDLARHRGALGRGPDRGPGRGAGRAARPAPGSAQGAVPRLVARCPAAARRSEAASPPLDLLGHTDAGGADLDRRGGLAGRWELGDLAGTNWLHFAIELPPELPRALEGTFVAFRWRVAASRQRRIGHDTASLPLLLLEPRPLPVDPRRDESARNLAAARVEGRGGARRVRRTCSVASRSVARRTCRSPARPASRSSCAGAPADARGIGPSVSSPLRATRPAPLVPSSPCAGSRFAASAAAQDCPTGPSSSTTTCLRRGAVPALGAAHARRPARRAESTRQAATTVQARRARPPRPPASTESIRGGGRRRGAAGCRVRRPLRRARATRSRALACLLEPLVFDGGATRACATRPPSRSASCPRRSARWRRARRRERHRGQDRGRRPARRGRGGRPAWRGLRRPGRLPLRAFRGGRRNQRPLSLPSVPLWLILDPPGGSPGVEVDRARRPIGRARADVGDGLARAYHGSADVVQATSLTPSPSVKLASLPDGRVGSEFAVPELEPGPYEAVITCEACASSFRRRDHLRRRPVPVTGEPAGRERRLSRSRSSASWSACCSSSSSRPSCLAQGLRSAGHVAATPVRADTAVA